MRKPKKIKEILKFSALAASAVLLFANAKTVSRGAADALALAADPVIPSLFPMLVLTGLISKLGLPKTARRLLFLPFGLITGLSDGCSEAFLFGQTAGFPVGIKTTAALAKDGRISYSEAKASALINLSPGLAFAVTAAGGAMFGSRLTGATLWLSTLAANMLAGIAARFTVKEKSLANKARGVGFSEALIGAVGDAAGSVISICAWMTAFGAFSAPLKKYLPQEFRLILEVTDGCVFASGRSDPALAAFSMGFGGLCVFFQLLPELKSLGVNIWLFLLTRLFCGGAAYLFQKLLSYLLPLKTAAFSYGERLVPSMANLGGSAALLLLSVVFVYSLSDEFPKQNKKIQVSP